MYGNFGNYGYNPFSYGAPQPAQQRLNELQQQAYPQYSPGVPQGPQNAQMLKGRVVGSVEEAKAAQVDLDGSVTYFASPGEGKIYAKSIGMNGLPVFNIYEIKQENTVVKNSNIEERITALELKVKELTTNEQCTVVSTNGTARE